MEEIKRDKKKEMQEWAKADRKRFPNKYRNMDLIRNFGITLTQYNDLLEKQNGVCCICGNPEVTRLNHSEIVRNLAVDHCHTTGKVRGLLCTACNQGLGNFRDNPDYLAKAISYVVNNGP